MSVNVFHIFATVSFLFAWQLLFVWLYGCLTLWWPSTGGSAAPSPSPLRHINKFTPVVAPHFGAPIPRSTPSINCIVIAADCRANNAFACPLAFGTFGPLASCFCVSVSVFFWILGPVISQRIPMSGQRLFTFVRV